MLETLLAHGYEFAFVSNADNLGAELDPTILGYFVAKDLPFLMEVADRTAADRKGGHLARRKSDGRLVLRESAQCPDEDMDAFQDIDRHRYFNTNNLWLNLPALKRAAGRDARRARPADDPQQQDAGPARPGFAKGVPARNRDGRGHRAVRGRGRAARAPHPLCAGQDLRRPARRALRRVRADRRLADQCSTRRARWPRSVVSLDPRYYQLIDELEARFPYGPPSLVECERLTVTGDVRFGRGVVCRGTVTVSNET